MQSSPTVAGIGLQESHTRTLDVNVLLIVIENGARASCAVGPE